MWRISILQMRFWGQFIWWTWRRYKKFWEALIPYFPFIWHERIENDASKNLPTRCLAMIGGHRLWQTDQQTLFWYDTDRKEKDASNNYYISECILCRGNVFTEPLPSNDRGYTYGYGDWWKRFMKYAIQMGSGVMICIVIFIKICSGVQYWYGGIHIQTFFYYYYLVCEAVGTATTPGLLSQPRVIMKMIVEKQIECRWEGEAEVLGENLPQRHFCPSQNPTWPDLGLNPGRRSGKAATNRLSYGAAHIQTYRHT
jgi:hypothetical protein